MSGRDLIYRDLSCWPTPLHYHPAHACGPFYLTLLRSLPPSLSFSRYLSLSVCLSVIHISYAYNLYVRPNQMDLPLHKRFIFSFKSKRDMQLIVRDPLPPRSRCRQSHSHAFLSVLGNVMFEAALKVDSKSYSI